MEPSAVIPHYEQHFQSFRRPSNLALSFDSSTTQSPEPSPTRTRFTREPSETSLPQSTTPSLTSNDIVKGPFRFVGPEKQRYHASRLEAPYPLPCGLEELSRMNMLHYVLYHTFGKRDWITKFDEGKWPKRVLDIGCGTGIWIHEVAKEWKRLGHADVEFHGIDLVPIQSPMDDVNVKFYILNFLSEELPFEDGYFDYVHIRCVAAGVPENCWLDDHQSASGLLDKALRVLRVNGYFEMMEMNLLFSYFDTSTTPPRQLPPEQVFSKDDTVAPVLQKVFTEREHAYNQSQHIKLGINPFPLSILSAVFTFLPLTHVQMERHLMPIARYNVPLIKKEDDSTSSTGSVTRISPDTTQVDVEDSVARLNGYLAAMETYSSLKPALLHILQKEERANPYLEFRRIEHRSHRKWLGMDIPEFDDDHETSTLRSQGSISTSGIGGAAVEKRKSVHSEVSKGSGSGSMEGPVPIVEREEGEMNRIQLKREVAAWWGRKSAD